MTQLTSTESNLYYQGSAGLLQRLAGFEGPIAVFAVISGLVGPALDRWLYTQDGSAAFFLCSLWLPLLVNRWRSNVAQAHEFTLGMRRSLELRYGIGLEDGCSHVGISFETRDRLGSKRTFWDIGFLTIGDRLVYFGDNRVFDLSRDNILRVRVVPSFTDFGSPRLHVEYRETPHGAVKHLVIQARVGVSRTQQYAELQRLRAQIAFLPAGVTGHLLGLPEPV